MIVQVIACGGNESHASETPMVVGAFSFNPSSYSLSKATVAFSFSVVAANGVSPLTSHVKLRNVTDGEDVAASIFNIVDSTTATKYNAVLTVGAGAGLLKPTEKIYECRIYLDAPPADPETDTIELFKAELRVTFTVL